MSSASILDAPSQQHRPMHDEIPYTTIERSNEEVIHEDLVTPDEAARIMSKLAGYEITPDDVRQLRRRKKIMAAKQTSRMTWYKRSEIEKATPPKKHNPKRLEDANMSAFSNEEKGQTEQSIYPHLERVLQIVFQRIELEERRLALEERRLALEERRLALEEKQLETKRMKMGLAS